MYQIESENRNFNDSMQKICIIIIHFLPTAGQYKTRIIENCLKLLKFRYTRNKRCIAETLAITGL